MATGLVRSCKAEQHRGDGAIAAGGDDQVGVAGQRLLEIVILYRHIGCFIAGQFQGSEDAVLVLAVGASIRIVTEECPYHAA